MSHILLNQNWTFKATRDSNWLEATVPGCVHTDLLKHSIIQDPFYGINEQQLQWIDKQDWEYKNTFNLDESILTHDHLELTFDGLDTYADVKLNGHLILSADNMFRTWKVDVKPWLKSSNNELHIIFRSPINEDLPKLEALGYGLPATNDQSELGGLQDKKVSVFARKAPYHYGWDWGPRLVTSGIWRDIKLEAWSDTRLTDLYIQQDKITAEQAQLTAIVEIESDTSYTTKIQLTSADLQWEQEVSLTMGINKIHVPIVIDQPKLWWSRGLGEPHLYTFTVALEATASNHRLERTVRTGLRSIELIRKKDSQGASFYFELNGIPVFAKGANHIPNDSFVTRITEATYRHEIETAVRSNMNMLRVWGGGIYESDIFYDLCDEYGLLVWQDFMFACSMYPGDDDFLASVKHEAHDNVLRLRNHPCIALWCGNNEIDMAWAEYNENGGWGWKKDYTPKQRQQIWGDYQKIFHDLLPEVISQLHSNIAYWPSSPLQALTENEDQHSHPLSTTGDVHYWGVWHGTEPFHNYNKKVGRFMSEYGFQSFPEEKSVYSYAEEEDMWLESEVMLSHQRSPAGNPLIKKYMEDYLPEPSNFHGFLYMSQILQAEAMSIAIEAHRRRRPYCMGSLYWQINDCWPVASWASMDYYGRWKAAQYYIKNSMEDILVSVDDSSQEQWHVHVVSDLLQSIDGELILEWLDFDGKCHRTSKQTIHAKGQSSTLLLTLDVQESLSFLTAAGLASSEAVLRVTLKQNEQVLSHKLQYFASDKELQLKPTSLVCASVNEAAGVYTITSTSLAKSVWITTEKEGILNHNFIDIIPGEAVTVQFLGRTEGKEAFIPTSAGNIQIRSMIDFI